jgi:hypothetical protein
MRWAGQGPSGPGCRVVRLIMTFKSQSDIYRTRALACEQRAKQASDQAVRQEWEELAIEWHAMASFTARDKGKIQTLEE